MSKLNLTADPCKPLCDCKACDCQNCPNVLQKQNLSLGNYVCNHGTRPKCGCDTGKPVAKKSCQPCCLTEPEPVPDPERTQSMMKVLKYDKGCNCKVVTRAVRADVHRYLGMVDRHLHKSNL